jgi:hypothetical protein
MNPPRPNWLEIGAHFIFGFVIGALIGFAAAGRRYSRWLTGDLLLAWIIGAGLIGGAVAATEGNTLWYRWRSPLLGVAAPEHSRSSFFAMRLVGIAGAAILVGVLVRRFGP